MTSSTQQDSSLLAHHPIQTNHHPNSNSNSISIQIDSHHHQSSTIDHQHHPDHHPQSPNQPQLDNPPPIRSRLTTPEAHEVKSVRKQVEGMGVETHPPPISPPQPSSTLTTSSTSSIDSTTSSILTTAPQHSSSTQSSNLPPNSNLPHSSPTTRSRQLPASWDAYADLHSPFACFAPKTTASIFSTSSNPSPNPIHALADDDPLAHTLPLTPKPTVPLALSTLNHFSSGSNSVCPIKFPSGSDFFLKGKRNTPVVDLSPDADSDSATQHKKLKLPPSGTKTFPELSLSPSSCRKTHGFASYSTGPSTSLRSSALEKFNSNPLLQTSYSTPLILKPQPPSSITSSACAVNGESDGSPLPDLTSSSADPPVHPCSHSTTTPSLGFSAFADSSGFHDSIKLANPVDWSGGAPSVFDRPPEPQPFNQPVGFAGSTHENNSKRDEWGSGGAQAGDHGKRKTHLALSAELSQEGKHEGFLATEVITGEEDEELVKSVRCKVFTLGEDGSWRERGTGGLRLLRTKEEPYRYRLIMRADAVLRVLLNVPIFKGFSYRPTQDKFLTFASPTQASTGNEVTSPARESLENEPAGGPKPQFQQYLCRFGKPETRKDIIESIEECLKYLRERESEAITRDKPEDLGDDHSKAPRSLPRPGERFGGAGKPDENPSTDSSGSAYQTHEDDGDENTCQSVDGSDLV